MGIYLMSQMKTAEEVVCAYVQGMHIYPSVLCILTMTLRRKQAVATHCYCYAFLNYSFI